jgi:hypothetical protein
MPDAWQIELIPLRADEVEIWVEYRPLPPEAPESRAA